MARSCDREGVWLEGWKSLSGMPTPACNRLQLRRREAGWGASGGEEVVRRITNSIRPHRLASLRAKGEARTCSDEQEAHDAEGLGAKATKGTVRWLETEGFEGQTTVSGETCAVPASSRPAAGVRALVVAMKPGNAGGAKGCRKREAQR